MTAPRDPALERYIQEKIATGEYENASEVRRELLLQTAEEDKWKADVRAKIRDGLKQVRAGLVVDGEKAVDAVLRRIRRRHGDNDRSA